MPSTLQKYTIFNKSHWQTFLPAVLTIATRAVFIFFYQNQHIKFNLLENFIYPLLFDSTIFLFGFLIFRGKLSRIYFTLYTLFLVTSNLIYFHHFKLYHLPPGTGAIAALFETTPIEAIEFTKMTNLSELIHTLIISFIPLIGLIGLKYIELKYSKLFRSCILLILISLLVHLIDQPNQNNIKPIDYSHTFRDIKNTYHYGNEYYTLLNLRENRAKARFNSSQLKSLNKISQTHILVIGESLSRSHMSIYGYPRITTPRLDTVSNILIYKNAISPTTQTRSSLVRMLTTAFGLNTDRFYEEGSIITAMNEAGYQTYWISNQGRYGISDTETSAIADDANLSYFVNTDWHAKSLDEKIISPFKKALKKDEKHQFIIIHLLGSHFDYTKRIPDGYKFKLNDNSIIEYLSPHEQNKVNQYDATVKYTDFVIDSIISILRNSRTVSSLTFVSDHGEDIYDDERKLLGHGSPIVTRYTVEIPFLVWQSDSFKKIAPIPAQKKQLHSFYNNGNLFHSLCNLYGLELEDFKIERSIFSIRDTNSIYPFVINSNNEKINYFELIKK